MRASFSLAIYTLLMFFKFNCEQRCLATCQTPLCRLKEAVLPFMRSGRCAEVLDFEWNECRARCREIFLRFLTTPAKLAKRNFRRRARLIRFQFLANMNFGNFGMLSYAPTF